MKWREIGPNFRELWDRPAGPMNWKNPIRVFAVLGWLVVQGFVLLGWVGWGVFQGLMLLGWTVFRVMQFVLALPARLLFFFGGVWYAVWSFVRRPFPSLDEYPILALVQYHTPDFFTAMVLWYYLTPHKLPASQRPHRPGRRPACPQPVGARSPATRAHPSPRRCARCLDAAWQRGNHHDR